MKTDWKDDIFTKRKFRMEQNDDGTVTPVDETVYTQKGDSFGAKELNAMGAEVNEVKKSVSDGKAEIAAAITLKRVTTAASATFHQMAENIKKIVLGSGNAQPADVRKGKTFTNDEGIEKAGTMPEYVSGTKGILCGLNDAGLFYYIGAGYWIKDGSIESSWVYMTRDEVATVIGLNPDYMLDSLTVLGKQGKIQSMAGTTITPQTYAQTVWSAWKRMTGNVEIAAVPLPPANVIKKGYRYWIGGNYVDGTFEGYVPTPTDLYLRGNNVYGWKTSESRFVKFDTSQITLTASGSKNMYSGAPVNLAGFSRLNLEGIFTDVASVFLSATDSPGLGGNSLGLASIGIGQTVTNITIDFTMGATKYLNLSFSTSLSGAIYRIWLS